MLPIRLYIRYIHRLGYHLGGASQFDDMTNYRMNAFLAEFGLEGARTRRFVEGSGRPMLTTLEAQSALLPKMGQRLFDALTGRELNRLCELLGIEMHLRERDYLEPTVEAGP